MAKEHNRELFETMPVPRAVRTMAVPTIIGQLIILIYSMADTFFIGRTNDPLMVAGASLILPVFNICLPIASVMGIGGGSLISRLLGERCEAEARRVSSFSILCSAVMALLFSAGMLLFMEPLLHLLGAGPEVYVHAHAYAMCVIVFGALPTILTNVLANLIRCVGESGKAGFGVTLGGVINMILDPLFMFLIMPKGHEIVGAGVATCLSNCISCLYFVLVIRRMQNKGSVLGLTALRDRPETASIRRLLAIGIPSAVATLLFDVDYIVINKLMSGYSDTALAAIGIVLKAERLPLNIGIGICQGMMPIIAYNYSARNYKRMRETSRFALSVGIACAAVSIVLYELFAPQIMRFFIGDALTVSLGTGFLRVRSPATLLMFMSFFHVHLFNGYGRGQEALLLGVMRWAGFNIPMLFLLNALMGMSGIVWAQLAGDILTVALSLAVHRRFIRRVLEPQMTGGMANV